MKKTSIVALVAIAIGVLAWACSDQSSVPTASLEPGLEQPAFDHRPGHTKGGGGGGGGNGNGGGGGDDGGFATAAFTGGMTTSDPAAHPVKGKENKRSLDYSTDQNALAGSATLNVDFSAAADLYANGGCTTNRAEDAADLAAQLKTMASGATVAVVFDKTADGSASTGHGATAVFGDYRIGLPPHRTPTGTIVSDDGTTLTMTFTGGDVRVWRISDDLRLFCPNPVGGDTVTVTVTR